MGDLTFQKVEEEAVATYATVAASRPKKKHTVDEEDEDEMTWSCMHIIRMMVGK